MAEVATEVFTILRNLAQAAAVVADVYIQPHSDSAFFGVALN